MADMTSAEIEALVARLQSDHERLADLTENIDFPAFYLEAASDYGDNAGEAAATLSQTLARNAELEAAREALAHLRAELRKPEVVNGTDYCFYAGRIRDLVAEIDAALGDAHHG